MLIEVFAEARSLHELTLSALEQAANKSELPFLPMWRTAAQKAGLPSGVLYVSDPWVLVSNRRTPQGSPLLDGFEQEACMPSCNYVVSWKTRTNELHDAGRALGVKSDRLGDIYIYI